MPSWRLIWPAHPFTFANDGVGSLWVATLQSLSFVAGKSRIGKDEMVRKSCPPNTVKAAVLLRGQSSQEHPGNAIAIQRRLGGKISVRARAELLGKHRRPVLRNLLGEAALEFVVATAPLHFRGAARARSS